MSSAFAFYLLVRTYVDISIYYTFLLQIYKNNPQKQIIRQKVTILFAYLTKNNYLCSEFQINRQKWTCTKN